MSMGYRPLMAPRPDTDLSECSGTGSAAPALQRASGGNWAGCVDDVERIVAALAAAGRGPR